MLPPLFFAFISPIGRPAAYFAFSLVLAYTRFALSFYTVFYLLFTLFQRNVLFGMNLAIERLNGVISAGNKRLIAA